MWVIVFDKWLRTELSFSRSFKTDNFPGEKFNSRENFLNSTKICINQKYDEDHCEGVKQKFCKLLT